MKKHKCEWCGEIRTVKKIRTIFVCFRCFKRKQADDAQEALLNGTAFTNYQGVSYATNSDAGKDCTN